MASLADRFWGSQQAQRATQQTSWGRRVGELNFGAVCEAACVARLEGWAMVEVGMGARGDVVVTGYVK